MTECRIYLVSARGDASYYVAIPYVPGRHTLARDVPVVMYLLAEKLGQPVEKLDRFDQVEMIRSSCMVASEADVTRAAEASSPR